MESEHRVKDGEKWIWRQIGSRPNHLWDCEVMQVVAVVMLKLVYRVENPLVQQKPVYQRMPFIVGMHAILQQPSRSVGKSRINVHERHLLFPRHLSQRLDIFFQKNIESRLISGHTRRLPAHFQELRSPAQALGCHQHHLCPMVPNLVHKTFEVHSVVRNRHPRFGGGRIFPDVNGGIVDTKMNHHHGRIPIQNITFKAFPRYADGVALNSGVDDLNRPLPFIKTLFKQTQRSCCKTH